MVLDYCVDVAEENCMIRLIISPSPRLIKLPEDYELSFGKGVVLREGNDAVIFSYGPVMLHEALKASELLEEKRIALKVVNLPWLNRIDLKWFENTVGDCESIFTLDNHFIRGGTGEFLLNATNESNILKNKEFIKFGLKEYPAFGNPPEVLKYHGLDGFSLASRIQRLL